MSSNLSKDVLIESLRKHIGKLEIENEIMKMKLQKSLIKVYEEFNNLTKLYRYNRALYNFLLIKLDLTT